MKYLEAINFIQSSPWQNTTPGLSRMYKLMSILGNPQDSLKFIHIAGTNGKGSTSAMISSILKVNGYKTGLYTSPHLIRYNERMKINDIDISDAEFVEVAEKVRKAAKCMDEMPKEFEILTAMAFCYFAQNKVDIVVLEVGLGGRFDATNIIKTPMACVICNIGLDHTAILGKTIEKITYEKAGIIKQNSKVILYNQPQNVINIVREQCKATNSELIITSPVELISRSLDSQSFKWQNKEYNISLAGSYQLKNASTVLETMKVLNIDPKNGLENVYWPGRFHVLSKDPIIVLDGAHNVNGVEALEESIKEYFPSGNLTFVMGVMNDKDYSNMISLLSPYAKRFIVEKPNYYRSLDSRLLAETVRKVTDKETIDAKTVDNAIEIAKNFRENIVIFGSLYQQEEILPKFCAKC